LGVSNFIVYLHISTEKEFKIDELNEIHILKSEPFSYFSIHK
jgi:hypothetical protein